MIYINHSFHNGFFHRVFDGSTAPRMRAQYPHLSHEYDHGVPRELPWGHYTVFGSSPGLPGKPTKAPLVGFAALPVGPGTLPVGFAARPVCYCISLVPAWTIIIIIFRFI